MINRIIKTLFITIILYATPISAEDINLSDLSSISDIVDSFIETNYKLKEKINIAGKQKMLTQRITKLSILISKNIKIEKNIKKLDIAKKQYTKNLITLKSNKVEITKQLEAIEKLWIPFLENIENVTKGKNIKESINFIANNNMELFENLTKLINIYKTFDKSLNYLNRAKLESISIVGNQRTLIEKMSKEKILLLLTDIEEYREKLRNSIEEFDEILKILNSGNNKKDINLTKNPKILKKLLVIENLWKKLKPLYKKKNITDTELSKLIRRSSLIALESNILVKIIELEKLY